MKRITVREARQALSRVEALLDAEGELTVTRRGRPVARIVPVGEGRAMPSHEALRKSLPRLAKGSARYVREDRDAR